MDLFGDNLGFCGILKKSFDILCSHKIIFLQISLALILPIGIISQIFSVISPLLLTIIANLSEGSSSSVILVVLVLIHILAIISSIILGLLATAAIVIAAAQTYLQIPLNFPSIIKRTPRTLKKLFITFLWSVLLNVVYIVVLLGLAVLVLVFFPGSTLGLVILIVLLICYLVGSLYISIVTNVASVVSVLEEAYGRAAIVRSRDLVRGKEIVTGLILIICVLLTVGIQLALRLVVIGDSYNVFKRVIFGVASCVVLMVVASVVQVIYTVLYVSCRVFHTEVINGSLLASHLDAYLGGYVALKVVDSG